MNDRFATNMKIIVNSFSLMSINIDVNKLGNFQVIFTIKIHLKFIVNMSDVVSTL